VSKLDIAWLSVSPVIVTLAWESVPSVRSSIVWLKRRSATTYDLEYLFLRLPSMEIKEKTLDCLKSWSPAILDSLKSMTKNKEKEINSESWDRFLVGAK